MPTNYTINLKPVYSQTAPTPENVKLPDGLSLSWHQVETFKALLNSDMDVVFNIAMTGNGKSLADFLSAMTNRTYILALYPSLLDRMHCCWKP